MTGPPVRADLPARSAVPEESALLAADYDVGLIDLDGVVYVGGEPVPRAAAALQRARKCGMRLAYVTNNASRRPPEVAAVLRRMGVDAEPTDVVTSAQAAAHLLADRLGAGARVLVVGSEALADELQDAGLTPVRTADTDPAAVVQGYAPDTTWRDLAEATAAIRQGALWVATNTDSTLPSPRGPLPGNGALVAAVKLATDAEPEVVGKPEPGLHRESVARTGARRPLVVGDRLDTDIAGASRVGADSLLVLTGVTTPAMLVAADRGQRPTYIGRDLCALVEPHPGVDLRAGSATCRGFTARATESAGRPVVLLDGDGDDELDALRAVCAAAWRAGAIGVRADGARAAAVLHRLGMDQPR